MMLYRLIASMDRDGFENQVVALGETHPIGPLIERTGVRVLGLGMQGRLPNPLALVKLVRLCARFRPQLVQTWLYHSDLIGIIVAKLMRVPVICCSIHAAGIDLDQYSMRSKAILRLLTRLSRLPTSMIAVSKSTIIWHEALGYRPKRWEYIPIGCDMDTFRPRFDARAKLRSELGLEPDVLVVGLVGRYHPWKDHANFLRAVQIASQRHPNLHAILAGRGLDSGNVEIMEMIARLGLRSRVHLLGERNDVPGFMPGLDINCLSSYVECSPTVLSEAMSCEVTCLATDVGDCRLIIGDTGKLVPPKDSGALARALIELIELGPESRSRLGQRARQRVSQAFSLTKVVSQHQELYRELVREAVE